MKNTYKYSAVLLLVVVMMSFSFKKKHIIGKWKVDIETSKKANDEKFRKKADKEIDLLKNLSLEFKKGNIFKSVAYYGKKKMIQEGTFTIMEGRVDIVYGDKKEHKLVILKLSKKKLVLKENGKNEVLHFYKTKN